MKTIINFIILILLTSLTYAITIGNPLPTITTTFNEPVILSSIDAILTDIQTNPIQIENTFISLDNKTVKYRPIAYLSEGDYIFSIKAQDIYGNLGELQTQSFTINVPCMPPWPDPQNTLQKNGNEPDLSATKVTVTVSFGFSVSLMLKAESPNP